MGLCCEIAASSGEMAGLAELERFAAEHNLPMVAIDDLVAYALEESRAGLEAATA